ncbi:MAG: extracellular solute-binding protein [Ruminococcaceae bacterium]|nr:extracellular solute-binding protein [Oscillospiraceae bacterium]
MKKWIAMALVLLLVVSLFAGCSKGGGNVKDETNLINTESLYPVVNEPVTLTLAVTVGVTNEDPEKMWFFDYMEEQTGVHTDYMIIQSGAWEEKKPIMLATDDLPDIFFGQTFSTTEIMKYGKAGTFIKLNDYIDTYGDMIKEKLDMAEGAWTGIRCPDGNIYSLPKLKLAYQFDHSSGDTSINTAWTANLGIDTPSTLNEFYDMLVAFRDKDADGDGDPNNEIPLSGSSTERPVSLIFMQAFGYVENRFDSDDNYIVLNTRTNEARYFPLTDEYYDYLTYMNKLWTEGLLDPDYFTQTNEQFKAKGEAGLFGAGAFRGAHGFTLENWSDWTLISPLVDEEGATPVSSGNVNFTPGCFTITKACEYPATAVRWANLYYTPEVCKLILYGPEYGSEDDPDGIGAILYVEEDGAMHEEVPAWNPDEMGLWDYYCQNGPANSAYELALDEAYQFQTLYGSDPVRSGIDYENHWRLQYLDNVGPYVTCPYPPVYLSDDSIEKINEISTSLHTYVEEMEAKFIIGTESLDNFDDFIEQLKQLGAEDFEKIYIDAYKDYLNNQK